MLQDKVLIKEIFESVQGEGPYVGINQLFIRFSNCNLKCKYCDTDFRTDLKEYSVPELYSEIKKYNKIHSVSLTGGEPLIEVKFLKQLLPLLNKKVYLETNGTLYENLKTVIDYIDIVSMDIKLFSSSFNSEELFKLHNKFIDIAKDKELFFKVVFNEKISDEEIEKTIKLAKKNNTLIVLQPEMKFNEFCLSSDFINKIYYKFIEDYENVRLIPQVHKFLKIK